MNHSASSAANGRTGGELRRRVTLGVMATVIVSALPGVAHAGPPVRTPPADATYGFTLQPGEAPCGPITITYHDRERYTTLSNGTTIITGQLDATVSTEAGASITLHVSGPGKVNPDGSITGGGPWLLYSSHVLAYATGHISIPPGAPESVNDVTISGRRTDLCPLLGF